MDRRVASLNILGLSVLIEWPEPGFLSKLVRFLAYPTKRCWLGIVKGLSTICSAIMERIRRSPQEDIPLNDVEVGQNGTQGEESSPNVSLRNEAAEARKKLYYDALRRTFGEADLVRAAESVINQWGDERYVTTVLDRLKSLF